MGSVLKRSWWELGERGRGCSPFFELSVRAGDIRLEMGAETEGEEQSAPDYSKEDKISSFNPSSCARK